MNVIFEFLQLIIAITERLFTGYIHFCEALLNLIINYSAPTWLTSGAFPHAIAIIVVIYSIFGGLFYSVSRSKYNYRRNIFNQIISYVFNFPIGIFLSFISACATILLVSFWIMVFIILIRIVLSVFP